MADQDKAGPIQRAFQGIMTSSARQGWMVGLMEGALHNLKIVRDDAVANLQRVPNHKLSAEAEAKLTRAINDIEDLCLKLTGIACGDGPDGR